MAYEPQRWLLGLLPAGIAWVLGTAWTQGPLEADLAQRGAAALAGAPLDKPSVAVAGRDLAIAGAAFSDKGPMAAIEAAVSVYGVRLVDASGLGLIPEAKPYAWSATRDGAKIALAGSVPDPTARAALVASAKAINGADVADGMAYGRGAAGAGIVGAGAFALGELALLGKGSASISDGALSLSGTAPDSASFEKAMAALAKLPEGLKLAKADIAPPVAKPYVFAAVALDGALKLTGAAPSMAARDAILAQAKALFPTLKIDNGLSVAGGAPAGDFLAAAGFGLTQIAGLDKGAMTLTDASLAISGGAKLPGALEALNKAATGLAPGFSLAKPDISPLVVKPYVFAAEKTADAIHLTGSAPSAAARMAIEKAAMAISPSGKVVNDLVVAAGAPAGLDFAAAASFALAQLKSLATGAASLTDAALSVRGEAATFADAAAHKAALATLPAGLKLAADQIKAPPPPPAPTPTPEAAPAPAPIAREDCQAEFKATLSAGKIEFETGKAHVTPGSMELIKQLAAVAARCQVKVIEVGGHTDNEGSEGPNLALSRARAEAVAAELVTQGVPAAMLKAVGYGASKPIAGNDTEEGRAQNRRIEFIVGE